jgi:hypothetical protein
MNFERTRSDCQPLCTVLQEGSDYLLSGHSVDVTARAQMQGRGQLGVPQAGGVHFGHWAWASVYATL